MKKYFLALLFLTQSLFSFAQEMMVQNVSVTIVCKDLAEAKQKVNDFLGKQTDLTLLSYNESAAYESIGKKITLKVSTNKEGSAATEKQLPTWGFVEKRQLSTVSNTFEIEKMEMELGFLQKRQQTYENELKGTPKENPSYKEYFAEIRAIENQIFVLQKQIKDLKNQVRSYTYDIEIEEENTMSQNKNSVRFVNMPGVQYGFIKIENPQNGISSEGYQGFSLKYLFTKGKSFVEIGAFRSISNVDSASQFKELFMYSFGQDFYPTRFGRGSRRFLNLYTGYTVGGIFATAKESSRHIAYIVPRLGVELFKTRSILLDTNAGYFIPFYQNLNLRGLIFHASFNFLF